MPLLPFVTSNSTLSPSAKDLKPSPWIAEKCTNTSSPPSCEIKPNPLLSLNHFTVPCAILCFSYCVFDLSVLTQIFRNFTIIEIRCQTIFSLSINIIQPEKETHLSLMNQANDISSPRKDSRLLVRMKYCRLKIP